MLKISYDPARYEDATIGLMLGHLRTLLEAMPAGLERPVAELPVLTRAEQDRALAEWDGAPVAVPARRVSKLVAEQAARAPDAPAAVWESRDAAGAPELRSLSYRELNCRSNQVARRLAELGAGPGKIVALYMDRSPALLVALLGVMKSGAAYLPLDPAYPAERIAFMLADSAAALVVAHEHLRDALPGTTAGGQFPPVLAIGEEWRDGEWPGDAEPDAVAAAGRPRLRHLHVRLDRHAQGRARPASRAVQPRARSDRESTSSRRATGCCSSSARASTRPASSSGRRSFPAPPSSFPARSANGSASRSPRSASGTAITHVHLAAPVWHHWCDDLAAARSPPEHSR